ncbi:hypothetical protein V5O48_015802 [Marasmius crinis-equi]|uniref:Uncharacterized protein n=1 Tax=Marasmius crinis-equi TaxID=585013 RepID=A0ABR3ETJ7_9AGAR
MLMYKALLALALAAVASAAPAASCTPGPLSEPIYCGYTVVPSVTPPAGADLNKEMNDVLGGQIAATSPSHDVKSDYTYWYEYNSPDYPKGAHAVIGGVSTTGLNAEDLEKLVLGWPGKNFPGNVVPSWNIFGVSNCYYESKDQKRSVLVRRWDIERGVLV